MKLKIYYFCFLFFAAFSSLVFSWKCPIIFYYVTGNILDQNKKPVADANIFMFFDDYEYSTIEEKSSCITNEEGRYECKMYYDPLEKHPLLKKLFRGNGCNRKPKKIELIIHIERYSTTKRVIIKDIERYIKDIEIPLQDIQIVITNKNE